MLFKVKSLDGSSPIPWVKPSHSDTVYRSTGQVDSMEPSVVFERGLDVISGHDQWSKTLIGVHARVRGWFLELPGNDVASELEYSCRSWEHIYNGVLGIVHDG